MKKVLNKNIIVGFLLGMIITSLFGVSAATLYYSNQITYKPSDDILEVNNVEQALNDLYASSLSSDFSEVLTSSTSAKGTYTFENNDNCFIVFTIFKLADTWQALENLSISLNGGTLEKIKYSYMQNRHTGYTVNNTGAGTHPPCVNIETYVYKITNLESGAVLTWSQAGGGNNSAYGLNMNIYK